MAQSTRAIDYLCKWVRPYPNECPGYDIKRFDGEPSVLEL